MKGTTNIKVTNINCFNVYFENAAIHAAVATPAALGGVFLFVIVFVKLLDRLKRGAIVAALAVWFAIALVISQVEFNIYTSFAFAMIIYIPSFLFLRKIKGETTKLKATKQQMFIRFIISGSMVAFVVIISKLIGPLWGGIFAAFPAMYTSTFHISYTEYGKKFAKAIAANTSYAFIGFLVYTASVYFLFEMFGLVIGTIISYCVYAIVTYIFNGFFKR